MYHVVLVATLMTVSVAIIFKKNIKIKELSQIESNLEIYKEKVEKLTLLAVRWKSAVLYYNEISWTGVGGLTI